MQPESILRLLLTFGFTRGTNYRAHREQEANQVYRASICCIAYSLWMYMVPHCPYNYTFDLELFLIAGTELWLI